MHTLLTIIKTVGVIWLLGILFWAPLAAKEGREQNDQPMAVIALLLWPITLAMLYTDGFLSKKKVK